MSYHGIAALFVIINIVSVIIILIVNSYYYLQNRFNEIKKKRDAEEHAMILQSATRRKLSLRPSNNYMLYKNIHEDINMDIDINEDDSIQW